MPEEDGRSTKKNVTKQRKSTKNVLISPYDNKWYNLEEQIQNDILDKLSGIFIEYGLKAEKKQKFKGKNKSGSETEEKQKDKCSNTDVFDKKTKELRSQLVFGINEVTRHLERDNLRLVLVSGSAKPAVITKHLLELSSTRTCQALCLSDLNKRLSQVLEFRSILAIGFKKNISDFDHLKEFIDFCTSNAPTTTDVSYLDLKCDRSIESDMKTKNPDLSDSNNVTKQTAPVTMETNFEKQKLTNYKSIELAEESEKILKKNNVPVHKSQTEKPSEDYSRFYVYKTKKEDQIRNNLDFIAFSMTDVSTTELSEDEDVALTKDKTKSKNLKRKNVQDAETLIPVQIKQMKSNPKKQKSKKEKKK
ncbi:hypothetical protein KUTeg_011873 [Tegillarca granosa]|uniref:Ribosomal protein eL8/eL30/eS12/Gadd45 domain-containing protein n=1 Tax=Tegillarca granosa TaxID=220873 RepID=A0ABQ9EXY2_TEGGR|nr:hypothetical protein KUTeg_011873 [Tegillarca granosa]